MRRIGSALAAGVATAGLFGAFAWLNVVTSPPAGQPMLESFDVAAAMPDSAVPDIPDAPVVPSPVERPAVSPGVSPPPVAVASAPVAPPSAVTVPAPSAGAGPPSVQALPVAATSTSAAPAPAPAPAAPSTVGLSSYAARVRAWLLAHKRYPRRSRLHGEEGVVQLRFVLDRAGHLLDGALTGRSHHAALDEEALAMLRRAVPYPVPPGDVRGERIEIAAAIAFELPR